MGTTTALVVLAGLVLGAHLWFLFEYLLHRFAMHHLRGRGIMSREHLEHHVRAGWRFSSIHLLSWAGMLLVGVVAWLPLGWAILSPTFGAALAGGWSIGYFLYEYLHAREHLRAPRTRRQAVRRKRHFHHHFGHPMANHGVTIDFWDRVFGTNEAPDVVRVPRRMAQPWMLDDTGELLVRFEQDYVLVGTARPTADSEAADRVAAFASVAPDAGGPRSH
jgi:sterol desaturase/sphingolipid hydroxylase (fatty acid hydroxylase superfamily)